MNFRRRGSRLGDVQPILLHQGIQDLTQQPFNVVQYGNTFYDIPQSAGTVLAPAYSSGSVASLPGVLTATSDADALSKLRPMPAPAAPPAAIPNYLPAPTPYYTATPVPASTGFDLSSIPTWMWIAIAGAGALFFFKK